jgi:hypothetical protein
MLVASPLLSHPGTQRRILRILLWDITVAMLALELQELLLNSHMSTYGSERMQQLLKLEPYTSRFKGRR